jgi:N-acetylglucosamine kinase-like BadF-type ATPase
MRTDSLVKLPPALVEPVANADARFIMGIDGGATKTLAAVLDMQTDVLHFAHGGPSNEDAVGVKAAVGALLDVAAEAIERAGISEETLAAAVLGVAGTDTEAIARHVRAVRTGDWIVVNDVVGAWATATGARPGVGAISGTGSNVFGVGQGGRAWRAGGWGHLLGDEGSGYWLGMHSISAALHDRDGSGPATALSQAATEFFGLDSVEEVAALVYSKPLTKGEIAAFGAQTSKAADAGDTVARALYARAAAELGRQIAVVIQHTGLDDPSIDEFPVGLIGSAFKAGPVFVDPLISAVHEVAPRARVTAVEMAPVGGSLLLAAHACGRTLERSELARLVDTALGQPA